ncbi:MAG: cation:proton antiporter [Jatrophihabitans sp.]
MPDPATIAPLDVTQFLLDLVIIVVLARLMGALARKLGQPSVIGEIVAGVLLGPSLFGASFTAELFPAEVRPSLGSVADLGLVLFMFIIGYELDRELMRGREKVALNVSLGSIAVPLAAGFGIGLWLAGRHAHQGGSVPFALFVGASMSVTAFPVLARILTDRGMHRTRVGGLAIAAAAVDDVAAWSLLAVVVTIAGSHGQPQWHILLSPAYLLVMVLLVRPLMGYVNERYRAADRLTPDLLAVVLVLLLASAAATEWLGVHFIFGAFIMGAVMPRKDGESLRHSILERLEQISVLLLLPVFFVIAGLKVNLRTINLEGIVELLAILAAAIGGKFLGAYLGARSSGIQGRQAGALATLMNTRGLTEVVILTVGSEIGVLDESLFSLMVVMALVTTVMTGPLLSAIYPSRLIDRDIADAERLALGGAAGYRVLAVVAADADPAVVDVAADLCSSRPHAGVVLVRLLPQRPAARLEVGTGMGADLLAMTTNMTELHTLAGRVSSRGIGVTVYSQFAEDAAGDLTRQVRTADPDFLVLAEGTELAPDDMLPRTVILRAAAPSDPSAVAVFLHAGADASAALQVAAQIAAGRGLDLVLVGNATGRRERGVLADLVRHGLSATTGELPDHALVVGIDADATAHLVVRARPDDSIDDVDDWASKLSVQTADAATTTTSPQDRSTTTVGATKESQP